MERIFENLFILGMYTIFITPLTLIVGVINAIKKPKKEAIPYTIIAIISACLIVFPLIYILIK